MVIIMGILNTLFRSFCEFPVASIHVHWSVITPLDASGWCIGRIVSTSTDYFYYPARMRKG